MMRTIVSILYGAAYILIGVVHFVDPSIFAPLVPRILGFPVVWGYLSGVAEIVFGLGLCIPRYRRQSFRCTGDKKRLGRRPI